MIWNGKYVSVHNIVEKAYRDLGISDDINILNAVEWAGEAIELIGAPTTLKDKIEAVTIEDFKAKLPCDMHLLITCRGFSGSIPDDCDRNYLPMRYSTDAFHTYCRRNKDASCSSDLTYTVNDDYIFTNFEEGEVQLAYAGIPVDEHGWPVIPDQIKFREAVASHIKWKLGFIKWSQGKMPGAVYQKLEQDRDWYIGAAQSAGNMPNPDMMESIKNNWIRLIPKINQQHDGFRGVGQREERYTKNSHSIGRSEGGSDDTKDGSETFFNYKDSSDDDKDTWDT